MDKEQVQPAEAPLQTRDEILRVTEEELKKAMSAITRSVVEDVYGLSAQDIQGGDWTREKIQNGIRGSMHGLKYI